ncbi:hypothetical protein ACQB60_32425 [Actinomycetota bacterium Odt1-20B]
MVSLALADLVGLGTMRVRGGLGEDLVHRLPVIRSRASCSSAAANSCYKASS